MDQVRLPDLEVIRRYSIAVRREHAPAEEVLDTLQSDVEAIKRALRASAPARTSSPRTPAPRTPAPRASARRATPRRRPAAKSRSASRSRRRG